MSRSSSAGVVDGLVRSTDAALAAVEELTAANAACDVPDETAQRLLLAGLRLFASKVDAEQRSFAPLPESANATATEVAVTVTELMRAVDLNMFDLAMWSGRARPPEGP